MSFTNNEFYDYCYADYGIGVNLNLLFEFDEGRLLFHKGMWGPSGTPKYFAPELRREHELMRVG